VLEICGKSPVRPASCEPTNGSQICASLADLQSSTVEPITTSKPAGSDRKKLRQGFTIDQECWSDDGGAAGAGPSHGTGNSWRAGDDPVTT